MKKKILNLVLAAAMLLTFALSATGCADKRTPAEMLTDAAGKTSEQVSGYLKSEVTEKAVKSGSVSINLKLKDQGEVNVVTYLNEDASKQRLLAEAKLGYTFKLNSTQDSIAVSCEELLGSKTYGLDLKTINEKLSRLEDPSSPLYIGEDNVKTLKDALEKLTSASAEDYNFKELYDKYGKFLLKQVEESGKLEKTTEKGEITVSAQLAHEDLVKIYKALVTEIKADQQLKSLILSLQSVPGVNELPDDFYEGLDDSVKDFEEAEEKGSLNLKVVINKKTGVVKTAEVSFLENDKEVGKLTFANEDTKITFDFTAEETTVHFQMNLESKALKSMEATISALTADKDEEGDFVETNNKTELVFKWEASDASKSSYSLAFKTYSGEEPEGTLTLSGNITVNGKESMEITAAISIDYPGMDDEESMVSPVLTLMKGFEVTVTIKANDAAPAFPEYENILDMSDDSLASLVSDIMGKIGDIGGGDIDDPDFDFDDSDFDFDFDDSDFDF